MAVLEKIKEGETEVYVYKNEKISSEMPVFYNPKMEFNRNISVSCMSVVKEITEKPLKVCDVLAASGIMGIRYAKEALEKEDEIWVNDINEKAVEIIKKNVEINNLKNVRITQKNANILLSEEKFDVIDIDPFGSPMPFLDSAVRSTLHKGFLFITATDTAPLCGTYPRACFRKYGIFSFRSDFSKELGIRILISAIIRECAKHGKAFLPLFSIYREHFFRVVGRVYRSEGKTNKILKKFDYLSYCQKCGRRYFGTEKFCKCGEKLIITGAIYLGDIWEKSFVEKVRERLKSRGFVKEKEVVDLIKKEIETKAVFYYNIHKLSKIAKTNPPKLEKIIAYLQKLGFKASRTHFDPLGIRTSANYEEILKALKRLKYKKKLGEQNV